MNLQQEDIKTQNIMSTLKSLAKRLNGQVEKIDFDIRKTITYLKEHPTSGYDLINENQIKRLQEEDYILQPELDIVQEYIIRLKPFDEAQEINLTTSITTDAHKSLAKILIKSGSKIRLTTDVKKNLYRALNKIKAKNNIIIGLLDKDMIAGLNEIIKSVDQNGVLSKDVAIWLTKWKKPIPTINDAIVFNYLEKCKKEVSENDKIDYADRNFIIGVNKDEILVEYTKPKDGKSGRNYSGKFIAMKSPNIDNIPSFNFDDKTVSLTETQDKKTYKAKEEGFVSMENNVLKVEKELRLKNVNLKETGNVNPGLNTQVRVIVETGNAAEDAVGPDMLIEANEIIIDGSVGAGAVIRGKNVKIKGQTHSTTTIYADNLEVGVLKGTAYANVAKIKSFENANLWACDVYIEQLFTGKVNGKIVHVAEVRAPSEIRAYHAIFIKQLSCGDNKFFIDQNAVLSAKEKITTCKISIKESNKFIQEGEKDLITLSKFTRDNKQNFMQIKDYMKEIKEKNQKPKPQFVKIFKEYLEKSKALEDLQTKLDQAHQTIKSSQEILNKFDEQLKHTFIYNQGLKWQGINNVYFIFHGKNYSADRVIENLPAVEVVGVKETQKEGTIVAIGMKDDFFNIDLKSIPFGKCPCNPLNIEETKETQEENQEKPQEPNSREPKAQETQKPTDPKQQDPKAQDPKQQEPQKPTDPKPQDPKTK